MFYDVAQIRRVNHRISLAQPGNLMQSISDNSLGRHKTLNSVLVCMISNDLSYQTPFKLCCAWMLQRFPAYRPGEWESDVLDAEHPVGLAFFWLANWSIEYGQRTTLLVGFLHRDNQ
jgi:hypothetical protein